MNRSTWSIPMDIIETNTHEPLWDPITLSLQHPQQQSKRQRLTELQSKYLLSAFQQNPKPDAQQRQKLAASVGLSPRAIQIWYQNRRAKLRKEATAGELFDSTSEEPEKTAAKDVDESFIRELFQELFY